MQPVLSRAQVRDLDRLAVERGVPSLLLMENAGRGAADLIFADFPRQSGRRQSVVVVAGAGNNGGDGFVVARRLSVLGAKVEVFCMRAERELRGDALVNYRALVGIEARVTCLDPGDLADFERALESADVVVDALFGTGLERSVAGFEAEVIQRMNRAPGRRVALDIPSGIHADTGQLLGVAVRADVTVTFAAYKPGLFAADGLAHAGRVHVADIGVPLSAFQAAGVLANSVEASDVNRALPKRALDAHKVSAGRILVLAGSPGKIGAALLVARGALRAGAGLVTLAGLPDVQRVFDQRVLEAMSAELDPHDIEGSLEPLLAKANAVAVGPGLGFSDAARRIVERVVMGHPGLIVVDADAISHFRDQAKLLASAKGQLVLTPHTGELARLLGMSSAEIEGDRFSAFIEAIDVTRATVLLKGPRTLVGAPGKVPAVVSEGSPVLATGGTGDVLTGVIAALSCQTEPFEAAFCGAFLHGRAGRSWERELGAPAGLLAHELADRIPRARADLSETEGRMLPV